MSSETLTPEGMSSVLCCPTLYRLSLPVSLRYPTSSSRPPLPTCRASPLQHSLTCVGYAVLWAQRSSASDESKNVIYLTITAPDVPKESLKYDLTSTKLTFSGTNKARTYAVELEFFDEILPEESKVHHSGRGVEATLRKKEAKEEYWPRLLKEKRKLQFLKTDFDKVRLSRISGVCLTRFGQV